MPTRGGTAATPRTSKFSAGWPEYFTITGTVLRWRGSRTTVIVAGRMLTILMPEGVRKLRGSRAITFSPSCAARRSSVATRFLTAASLPSSEDWICTRTLLTKSLEISSDAGLLMISTGTSRIRSTCCSDETSSHMEKPMNSESTFSPAFWNRVRRRTPHMEFRRLTARSPCASTAS